MPINSWEEAARPWVRIAFWLALALLLALTLLPIEPKVPLLDDKAEHFLAFMALTVSGAVAWGRKRMLLLTLGLAALGAGIELLQALPIIARDAELLDWVADLGGVAAGFVLAIALRLDRTRVEPRHPR